MIRKKHRLHIASNLLSDFGIQNKYSKKELDYSTTSRQKFKKNLAHGYTALIIHSSHVIHLYPFNIHLLKWVTSSTYKIALWLHYATNYCTKWHSDSIHLIHDTSIITMIGSQTSCISFTQETLSQERQFIVGINNDTSLVMLP